MNVLYDGRVIGEITFTVAETWVAETQVLERTGDIAWWRIEGFMTQQAAVDWLIEQDANRVEGKA